MLTTLKPLLWKESREHLWPLFALLTVFLAPVLLGISTAKFHQQIDQPIDLTVIILATLCPAFIAMGTITREHAHHTFRTLTALPVPPWQTFAAKTIAGLFVVAVPPAIAYTLLFLTTDRTPRNTDVAHATSVVCWSSLLYLWILALAAGIKSEIRVAVTGLAVVSFWVALASIHMIVPERSFTWVHCLNLGAYIYTAANNGPDFSELSGVITTQTLIAALLFTLACIRYHRLSTGKSLPRSPQESRPAQIKSIRLPKPFLISPLLWKTWRESRLLLALSLVVSISIPLLITLFTPRTHSGGNSQLFTGEKGIEYNYDHFTRNTTTAYGPEAMNYICILASLIGILLAIVLSVGPVSRDLRPKLNSFWRSKPIPVKHYFLFQYLGNFATAFLAAVIPIIAVFVVSILWLNALDNPNVEYLPHFTASDPTIVTPSAEQRAAGITQILKFEKPIVLNVDVTVQNLQQAHRDAFNSFLASLLAIPWVYAIGTFLTVIFRRPIYSAILTIALASSVFFLPTLIRFQFLSRLGPAEPELALYILPLIPVAAYLTYRAFRSDFSLANSSNH